MPKDKKKGDDAAEDQGPTCTPEQKASVDHVSRLLYASASLADAEAQIRELTLEKRMLEAEIARSAGRDRNASKNTALDREWKTDSTTIGRLVRSIALTKRGLRQAQNDLMAGLAQERRDSKLTQVQLGQLQGRWDVASEPLRLEPDMKASCRQLKRQLEDYKQPVGFLQSTVSD